MCIAVCRKPWCVPDVGWMIWEGRTGNVWECCVCREELLKRALQATWDVLTSTEQPISTQIDQKVSCWSSADSELTSLAYPT